MARIRNIKPEAFDDPDLNALPFALRWVFAGLWCQADRDGRLQDDPRLLKVRVLPYDDVDMHQLLDQLAPKFIIRYEVDGRRYIQILNFAKHQRFHKDERPAGFPPPPDGAVPPDPDAAAPSRQGASTGPAPGQHRADTVSAPCEQGASTGPAVRKSEIGNLKSEIGEGERGVAADAAPPRGAPPPPHPVVHHTPRLVDTSHRSHAFCCRVCLPAPLHQQFVRQLGGEPDQADRTLREWYRTVADDWSSGPKADQVISEDAFAWWRRRFVEHWPPAAGTGESMMESAAAIAQRVMAKRAARAGAQ